MFKNHNKHRNWITNTKLRKRDLEIKRTKKKKNEKEFGYVKNLWIVVLWQTRAEEKHLEMKNTG